MTALRSGVYTDGDSASKIVAFSDFGGRGGREPQ